MYLESFLQRWNYSPIEQMGKQKNIDFPRLVKIPGYGPGIVVAFPVGFEPTTCRLEGGCSIRLSYGNLKMSSQPKLVLFQQKEALLLSPSTSRAAYPQTNLEE
jgi:hypothetical protein